MAYVGMKKMAQKLSHKEGVQNPKALAAYIARKKYGKKAVEQSASAGTSMRNVKPLKG